MNTNNAQYYNSLPHGGDGGGPFEFFSILQEAIQMAGDGNEMRCYHLLNIALQRAVDQRLAGSHIHFGGLFAKTDFLCKEHEIDKSVAKGINDLRQRLREVGRSKKESTELQDTLRRMWPQDVEALTLFLCAIFGVKEVPQELREVFPRRHSYTRRGRLVGDVMRMVVERWTDNAIYGRSDEMGEVQVVLSEEQQYMLKLLSEGCLINLVRPRAPSQPPPVGEEDASPVTAELLIYQPDYLVDISGIAACFENYADTPYVSLFNKLVGAPPTPAIHLGNLASQLLDEEVHDNHRPYNESVMEFFHSHAVEMAVAEGLDASFHQDAQRQKENIRIAVRESLEKEVGAFDATQVILEPSFFCEMLGLQGRMDLLQRDYRVLIEQKSGKGAFVPFSAGGDPEVPVYQEKHYVQMLLYMAMLHYGYQYEGKPIANADIQSFLLYSKYRKGLVRLGPAPELLRKAIMLRNQIAWCDMSYAKGGADILLRMKPEMLRRKKVSDNFWEKYVYKGIQAVLSPIQNATPLEQAYFLRMMRFVATEHVLSKMGNNNKENSGFAAKWHSTLADKMLSGNILNEGDLQPSGDDAAQVIFRTRQMSAIPNFRIGDIVVIYPYQQGHNPDIRTQIVHRATIEDMSIIAGHAASSAEESQPADAGTMMQVVLRLKNPQADASVFRLRAGWCWAMEHDFHESSTAGLYRSLHRFLSAPAHRKALILSQRQPDVSDTVTLYGDYGPFNDLVRGAMGAKDIYLVLGPPGTGKTSFGMLNILKEQILHIREEKKSGGVLVMAYTNRAVDEICSKLLEEGIDFLRIGSSLSCEKVYREYLLENRSASCRNIEEIRQLIDSVSVIVGTTTSLTGASTALFKLRSFELAIIDEASQILEPQILGLLSASDGMDVAIRRFVLIGDHKQLPAVVQQSEQESAVTEESLRNIGLHNCRNSLFERLYNNIMQAIPETPETPANPESPANPAIRYCYFLSRQGRMHPAIADFPNLAFYDGKLGIAGLPHQREEQQAGRITFYAVPRPQHADSDKVNELEAEVIAREVIMTCIEAGEDFNPLTTVGVIVPYRNQITAVRKAIATLASQMPHAIAQRVLSVADAITIDTVERYQGSQRDVIIYGFTVQYQYQLAFLSSATFLDPISHALIDRRLNVALTRAKKREIIVGNPDVLSHNEVFRRLIDYCKAHGRVKEIGQNEN